MSEASRQRYQRSFLAEVSRVGPGLYAWLATVLVPVLQRGAPWSARALAGVALLALGGAFVLHGPRPKLARWLGVYTFILACFGAWALLGRQLAAEQLDPVRSALGATGFLLHALAWGAAPRSLDAEPPDNLVPGAPLLPRHRPARLAPVVFGAGVLLALLPSLIAFGVERPSASLLAHAVALGAALLIVTVSVDVALRMGRNWRFAAFRTRVARATWPLGALALSLGIGLIWRALH
jgi:hypothetical protein